MKKINSIDKKSNFNTSCASDLHSSIISSVYGETSMIENIEKIKELKRLYFQACEEELQLNDQRMAFIQQLQISKSKLQSLISMKFGQQRNVKKSKEFNGNSLQNQGIKSNQIFKTGSINKVNKKINKRNNDQQMSINEFQHLNGYFNEQIDTDRYAHKKTISNLIDNHINYENDQRQIQYQRKYEHKFQKSTDFNQRKGSLLKVWNQNIIQSEDGSKNKVKKSYLSTPRASILNSPRNNLD